MKTILVTTDFSAPSQTAAHYAMYLANAMKAHLILCHAVQIPPMATVASQVSDPLNNYSVIHDEAVEQIEFQALGLSEQKEDDGLITPVDCLVARGSVTDVVNDVVKKRKSS